MQFLMSDGKIKQQKNIFKFINYFDINNFIMCGGL